MFKKLRYQGKIFISYSIVVMIIMTISTYFVQIYITEIITATEKGHISELTRKTAEQVDAVVTRMDQASSKIATTSQVVKILSNIQKQENTDNNYFTTHISDAGDIRNIILDSNGYQSIQDRISVISLSGDFVSVNLFDTVAPQRVDILNLEWFNNAFLTDQDKYLIKMHQDDWTDKDRSCFSYVRVIKSIIDVPVGLVEIQYPEKKFIELLMMDDTTPVSIVILDTKGDVFYEQIREELGLSADSYEKYQKAVESMNQTSMLFKDKIGDENIIYSVRKLPQYGINIILIEREKDFLTPVRRMTEGIFLAEGIVLLVTFVMIYGISKRLTKPIVDLRKSIEGFDVDTLSLDLPKVNKDNEMALLTSAFDLMLTKIRSTSSELVQSRTRELKANYLALQSQVDPHFLYNILTVIGTMGQQYGNNEILHMCSSLTQMLSYSTSMKTGHATIGMEIKHLANYLTLMKYRYMDFLTYELNVDERLVSVAIPKLSLLPIVENCFQHAFSNKKPPYAISIKGEILEDRWVIEVTDNGSGFSQEALANIQLKTDNIKKEIDTNSYSPDLEMGGLGLLNTFARFRLYYSGQETFACSNVPEGGGRITIGGLLEEHAETGKAGSKE